MDPLQARPGTLPEADKQAAPQPRDGAARWRQELERAQWALRTQRAAAAAERPVRGEPAPAVTPAARAPSPQADPAEASSFEPILATPPGEPGAAASGPAERAPEPARGLESLHGPAGALASAGRATQANDAVLRRASAEAMPWPERFVFERTHVHVTAQDGAAQVWVRDGTLDESQRRRLAAQVAARLRAGGVRLASIVVNGEEIHNLEGVTSWQSKQ